MLTTAFRRHVSPPALRWVAFYALILAAWVMLFTALAGPEAAVARAMGQPLWLALCRAGVESAGYWPAVAMWSLMGAAMMAPTLLPALKTYDDLSHTSAVPAGGFWALVGGYAAVWLGFAFVAAAAQLALAGLGAEVMRWGTPALLLLAGLYQFSPIKEGCLSKCRAPLTFFMGHWQPGLAGSARMGVQLGVVCLGCCWALMTLGLIGGAMSLIWMGLATLLMTLEKLPQIGRLVTIPLGLALLAGAGFTTIGG
jgi:predicted metal-binding membrane protein